MLAFPPPSALGLALAPPLGLGRSRRQSFFADDQAFDTIHAHGNSEIQTPNLDRLSARATTFTHAYNMGSWSGAVCVASRMMMISGKYLWHAQKDHAKTAQLYQEKGRMWPQLLEASGYDTYFTGKWHIRADLFLLICQCQCSMGQYDFL